jgi:hypothetical protein
MPTDSRASWQIVLDNGTYHISPMIPVPPELMFDLARTLHVDSMPNPTEHVVLSEERFAEWATTHTPLPQVEEGRCEVCAVPEVSELQARRNGYHPRVAKLRKEMENPHPTDQQLEYERRRREELGEKLRSGQHLTDNEVDEMMLLDQARDGKRPRARPISPMERALANAMADALIKEILKEEMLKQAGTSDDRAADDLDLDDESAS